MFLPSMFQISSTMDWHGLEDVEPLQDAKDKVLAQAQNLKTLHFTFTDPRSYCVHRKSQYYQGGDEVLLNGLLAQNA